MKLNRYGWPKPVRKPKSYNRSAPPIQVQARLLGWVQWVCPNCSSLHGTMRVKWRHSWMKCEHCHRRYRLGIGFSAKLGPTMPPFNAIFAGDFLNYITNRVEEMPPGPPMAGRLMGNIDWCCPDCTTTQTGKPDWDLQKLDCLQCSKSWYLRLIIYRSVQAHPIGTPFDWTPILPAMGNKRRNETYPSPLNPAAPPEASQVE